jgi:CRISPR-associated endonuclease Csy4
MSHYVDIQLMRHVDIAQHQMMDALFGKLHQIFVRTQNQTVGISFPLADEKAHTLGMVLRLHGPAKELQLIITADSIKAMLSYVSIGTVTEVPKSAGFRNINRVQVKSSPERLRRRAMRRHNLTPEQAIQRIPDTAIKTTNKPFINVSSSSTKQGFRLFISQGPIQTRPTQGGFNAYGLSKDATIPWF